MVSAAVILTSSVLATACGTRHPQATTPASLGRDTAVRRLQHDIDTLLAAPALASASWGAVVRSLTGGETLYQVNGRKLLVPASNMKIVTLAVAAERLGWDYTFTTALFANGPIEDGVLDGDLFVVGTGDPAIEDWDGQGLFRQWAEQLKVRGVRAISGRIIGDDNAFEDLGLGSGWAWDDLDRSYATAVGGLQFNQNSVQLTASPGTRINESAAITLRPRGTSLKINGAVVTAAKDAPPNITTRRQPGSSVLDVFGAVPIEGSPVTRAISVPNPTAYFVDALRAALVADGIDVKGDAVDIDELEEFPVREPAAPLFIHRSSPLSTLASTMMKTSQNLYAETLFKAMGSHVGEASSEAGREAVELTVHRWDVPLQDLVVADGSGLSRYNLITPQALLTILARVNRESRLREPFVASLPIAGRDGTLASRMRGTKAEGNARAKTGSLSNARALSGYVQTADGEPLAFSILANNFGVSSDIIDRTMDAIVVRLAEFTRGR